MVRGYQSKKFMGQWQNNFIQALHLLLQDIWQAMELQPEFQTFLLEIPHQSYESVQIAVCPPNPNVAPTDFQGVGLLAQEKFAHDPEQFFFLSSAQLDQAHRRSLYPKALRQAVLETLQQLGSEETHISFCSFPVRHNNHWLITVIQLPKQDFHRHYSLNRTFQEVNPLKQRRLERSFIEALIYQVLTECELELRSFRPNYLVTFGNIERVIEDAAANLMDSIEVRINQLPQVDLLSFANAIAAERYEGAASEGRLIICQPDHPDILAHIKLQTPIKIYNYRGIRKLLEASSSQMALLCDVETVWGLGLPQDTYQTKLENLFEIRFVEHHTWELVHATNIMMRVKYRQARLPRSRFDPELFCDHVAQLFSVRQDTAQMLVQAVATAIRQHHGTILVITSEAAHETQRLAAQSSVIEPVMISRDIIAHLSSVDGAILIAPNGMIHSFGVILDGKASANGSSTRGARYNSAIRYIDGELQRNVKCLALIVSEDGYVDLYPKLG